MIFANTYPVIMRPINPSSNPILTKLNSNNRQALFFFPPTIPIIPFSIIEEEIIQNATRVPYP